jgi:hypothetical protein
LTGFVCEAAPGRLHLKSQVFDSEEFFSNLKFFISNAFSCGAQSPNENALEAAAFCAVFYRQVFRDP